MEKVTLRLKYDLITSFFINALPVLLPSDIKNGSQCMVKKGNQRGYSGTLYSMTGKTERALRFISTKPLQKR